MWALLRRFVLNLPLATAAGGILVRRVVGVTVAIQCPCHCGVIVRRGATVAAGPVLSIFISPFGPLVCIFSKLLPCAVVVKKSFLYPDFNIVLPVQRSGVVTLCFSFVPV